MKMVRTSWSFESDFCGMDMLKHIERAGRTCYKSEDKITDDSALKFVKMITHTKKHHSVLEHCSVSVRIICDRGISHEIVRHRLGSYSQESTRYCNYCKEKFGNEITVIEPEHLSLKTRYTQNLWIDTMVILEQQYFSLLELGWTPQEARGVLPTELKTELVVTYNLRQWRHFFSERCSKFAHPQLRSVTLPMLKGFKTKIPIIFDDFEIDEENLCLM